MTIRSKNIRFFAGICLMVVCVFTLIMSVNATDENMAIVNNPAMTEVLNLREEPSIASRSLGRYYNGTQVIVDGSAGEWTKVRIGNDNGYMMSKYLKYAWETGNEPILISELATDQAFWGIVCTLPSERTLALQSAAQTDSSVLASLDDGAALQIQGELDDGWLYVQTADGKQTGYVPDDMIIRVLKQTFSGSSHEYTKDLGSVPLRTKPAEDGRVINTLRGGLQVGLYGSVNGYTLIAFGTDNAFMQYGYIETTRLHEMQVEASDSQCYASIVLPDGVDSAPLYRRPSMDAAVLGKYAKGSLLVVSGEMDDFYFVTQMDVQGFVRKEYLQLTDRKWSMYDRRHQDAIGYGVVRTRDKLFAPLLRFSEDNSDHLITMAQEGDYLLVTHNEGDWAQGFYAAIPGLKGRRSVGDVSISIYQPFIQSAYLDIIPIPSMRQDAKALALAAGVYTVGQDLPADIYTFHVPEGKEGKLTVTLGDNKTTHTPVPKGAYCIYSLYLPEGAKITIEEDGVLTEMDKTWVWGKVINAAYSGGYGRFVSGVNIDEIGIQIRLLPDATEGYYRVIPIDMDAQGILPEPVYLKPGESVIPPMGYGVFLEVYNCYLWTNG